MRPHGGQAAVDAGLDCAHGDAGDRGHLLEWEIEVVTKNKNLTLVQGQLAQGGANISAANYPVLESTAARLGDPLEPDDRPPAAAGHVSALVGHDGQVPRPHVSPGLQVAQLPP